MSKDDLTPEDIATSDAHVATLHSQFVMHYAGRKVIKGIADKWRMIAHQFSLAADTARKAGWVETSEAYTLCATHTEKMVKLLDNFQIKSTLDAFEDTLVNSYKPFFKEQDNECR